MVEAIILGWKDDGGFPATKPVSYWDNLKIGNVYHFHYNPKSPYPYQLLNGSGALRESEVRVVLRPFVVEDWL